MTDNLIPINHLRKQHQPQPPYITVRTAARVGTLTASKPYGQWLATTESYLEWLKGWPHPVGRPAK